MPYICTELMLNNIVPYPCWEGEESLRFVECINIVQLIGAILLGFYFYRFSQRLLWVYNTLRLIESDSLN